MNIPNNFELFLKSVFSRFPEETYMILGSADASPESGLPKLNTNSYALELILDFNIIDSREFDRATLGLKAFYEIITDQTNHWNIAKTLKDKISNWVKPQVQTQKDIDGWSYGILFNDLGKLHISNDEHMRLYGQYCADHDMNMVNILKISPEFYPNFKTLSSKYQQSLINGLSSGFNLGKAVQLECPSSAYKPFMALSDFDKNFHLGHSFFDFLGVSGAGNPRKYASFIMNDDNITGFMSAITNQDYYSYAGERLQQVGIKEDNLALARLMAMARVFDIEKSKFLLQAIANLRNDTKENLFKELVNAGSLENPAIELQYSPAILTQAVNSKDIKIVVKVLEDLNTLFKLARDSLQHKRQEIYILNLVDFAADLKANPDSTKVESYKLSTMSGGWRLTKI